MAALQRHNTENSKQIFPEKKLWGLCPNVHIYVSESDLYITMIGLPILLQEICRPILAIYKSLTDTDTWGTEAAQLPEKEYINGIFVAVCLSHSKKVHGHNLLPEDSVCCSLSLTIVQLVSVSEAVKFCEEMLKV
jgi:hypothetical protein